MIHQATQTLSTFLTMKEVKHRVQEYGELSAVCASFSGARTRGVEVRFLTSGEGNDIAVRIQDLFCVCVPEERKTAVRETLNRLNTRFRYVKFYLRESGGIAVEYDLLTEIDPDAVGPVCHEIFFRIIDIIDRSAPEIWAALAGGQEAGG